MCAISRNKAKVLSLYRMLLTESKKFPAYNYRTYFMRRIRDQFRENRCLSDAEDIQKQMIYGNKTLEMIRRQVIIGHLFTYDKLILEK